jgi:putative MATE family efflux protein
MRNRVDVLHGPILETLLLLMAPLLVCGLFQELYTVADGIIVGRFAGSTGLAIIGGSANNLISFFTGPATGLITGAMFIAAFCFGRNDTAQTRDCICTSLVLAAGFGLLVMILYWLLGTPMMVFLRVPDDVLARSAAFLKLYAVGFLPYCLFEMTINLMRASGESRQPTVFLILSFLINIVLDLVFVGWFHMEETGAAWAYILTQSISAWITVRLFLDQMDLKLEDLRPHRRTLKSILKVGIPAGASSMLYTLTNMLMQSSINLLGSTTIASYVIFNKIDNLYWIVMAGLGLAVTTFCGQCYGAGLMDRFHKGVKVSLWAAAGIAAASSILLYFGADFLAGLFSRDAEIIAIARGMLQFVPLYYLVYSVTEPLFAVLRALNRSSETFWITLVFVCGTRVAWILFYGLPHLSWHSILASYPISWAIASLVFVLYYRHLKDKAGDPPDAKLS